jgi:uncharacterized membrane protein
MASASRIEVFFQRLKPIHRLAISLAVATLIGLILPSHLGLTMQLLILWIAIAGVYIFCCWIVLLTLPIEQIKQRAEMEDGSRIFVYTIILIASFASLFAVTLLLISAKSHEVHAAIMVVVAITGMLISWCLVHTVFVFHYARMYYKNIGKGEGLDFPGDEEPDYLDFAYFSFVIGCTFQVSDVEITSRVIRRIVLFHGILAFLLNTFVVALTINIIAGLSN